MDRTAEVVEFRNRLVEYMNLILEHKDRVSSPMPEWVVARLQAEQPWLSQNYGRLSKLIHPSGVPQGMAMGFGSITTSFDVIADAIHNPGDAYYNDLAGIADQHLMMRIGQLQGEAQERAERRQISPDALYRLTSPLYWLGRLWALVRWIWGTWSGRITAAAGALLAIVVTALVNGWVGSLFP